MMAEAARAVGVGLLGPSGIGQAHAHAYTLVRQALWPAVAVPRLTGVYGRQPARTEMTRARYGFERASERCALRQTVSRLRPFARRRART